MDNMLNFNDLALDVEEDDLPSLPSTSVAQLATLPSSMSAPVFSPLVSVASAGTGGLRVRQVCVLSWLKIRKSFVVVK